jgi:hypothetical protein
MRKSPIRHHVRQHRRNGRPVHDYNRGHGSHPANPPSLRRPPTSRASGYAVHISYVSHPSETLRMNAPSFPDAIATTMEARRSIEPPFQIVVDEL